VIGKMSGIMPASRETQRHFLAPVTPGFDRAFLVEAFNRILISRICFDRTAGEAPFSRGIACFHEKERLLPFEEAKLYGHNATHALAAYVGAIRGVRWIADLRDFPGIMSFLRAAFIEESGQALLRKHAGVDLLFTPDGYRVYADDLLQRMVNPFLQDSIERVGRDPERKLAWDDRLIGTMRLALQMGTEPRRYAFGAAAALVCSQRDASWLESLWEKSTPEPAEKTSILHLIEAANLRLRRWIDSGYASDALP
jgi:mannitol-1-phosphate/altronate dehydrogenase